MKKCYFLCIPLLLVILVQGCGNPERSKPNSVTTVHSPIEGVFYTVEIYENGPLVSDTTRVYVHLERAGKSIKRLVLEGDYLKVEKITWDKDDPHAVVFCLNGGSTEIFRNDETLRLDDANNTSIRMYHYIRDCCSIKGCRKVEECCDSQ